MPARLLSIFDSLDLNLCYVLEAHARLLRLYAGKWILIEEGRLLDVGDEEDDLLVRRQGPASLVMYLPRVGA